MAKFNLVKASEERTNYRLTIQSNGRIFFSKSIERDLNIKQYDAVEITYGDESNTEKEFFLRFVRQRKNPDHYKMNVSGNYYYFISKKILVDLNLRQENFKNYFFTFQEYENADKKRYRLELKKKKVSKGNINFRSNKY